MLFNDKSSNFASRKRQTNRTNDDQILEIIAKEAKKRKESLADYEKSGREDLINQVKEEIEIINKYLPEQMEKEEIEK